MSDWVIRAEALGKTYQIYDKPRDRLKQLLWGNRGRTYSRSFHALNDVSFQVQRGETFGIVGRNGAGKSTLLQLIAGTLQATRGGVETRGRIAALLELGSGFNPEFTGLENIRLNASLLGAGQAEIEEILPRIIQFADIGSFIDQPVKTYSSGMMLRLAFSVVVHLNPDVLIVDEALAVGDIAFVGKCLAKISEYIDRGGTLLFVAHDINMVRNLTKRVLVLEQGRQMFFGPTAEGLQVYLDSLGGGAEGQDRYHDPDSKFEIRRAQVVCHDETFCLQLDLWHGHTKEEMYVGFNVYNFQGVAVFGEMVTVPAFEKDGLLSVTFSTEKLLLTPGLYTINCSVRPRVNGDFNMASWWRNAVSFQVDGIYQQSIFHQPMAVAFLPELPDRHV